MKIQRFQVSNAPHLTITSFSGLEIKGGREGEVAIKAYGPEETLEFEREGERITVTAHARCKIACPQGTSITVPAAHGNLRIQQLDGPIAVEQVSGDTLLKEVGPTTITTASGNVRARSVRGDLQINQVSGDFTVRGVEGRLLSDTVGGNLVATHLEGGLQVTAGGDGTLKTDLTSGCDYKLSTGGNATLRFPDHVSANIQVSANGIITDKVEWAQVEKDANNLTGRVGEGEANVEINASGDVSLRTDKSDPGAFFIGLEMDEDLELELESLAEELERNIHIHMEQMNARLEAQLSRIDEEAIRRKAEQAAEKVRRKAERAAERAKLKAERAQRRWQRMGGSRRTPRPPRAPSAPAAPRRRAAAPVTEEERMTVLKMVQEGKISADEAAQLLEAMEG